jgi:hypothetical protein
MNTLYFEDYEQFVEDIFLADDEYSINIVAKYYDAKEIVKQLILIGYDIGSINELSDTDVNGYSDEYIISVLDNDIWVSPAKRGNKYLNIETDGCFVLNDCNSKILSKIDADDIFEVIIGEEDFEDEIKDCDGDCEHCCCNDKYNLSSNSSATTASSTSHCFVNGKEVTKAEYDEAIKNISGFLNFVNKVWNII